MVGDVPTEKRIMTRITAVTRTAIALMSMDLVHITAISCGVLPCGQGVYVLRDTVLQLRG